MAAVTIFDESQANTYRKKLEVIAFPVEGEVEFTLSSGQRQIIRPGGWCVLGPDGQAHGVDGEVFAATYERVRPQTYRKKVTILAYQVHHPFSLETTLADGHTESGPTLFPAGAWVVRNHGGELYVIAEHEFARLYERCDAAYVSKTATRSVALGGLSLLDRLTRPGPKRILALDGGGVRGAVTLGILAEVENRLRVTKGPNAVLADHFDLIGGTSTGAIIAAALACGRSVQHVTAMYTKLAGRIFAWKRPLGGLLWDRYNHAALEAALDEEFGAIAMGDASIRTGLCIITKRVDTASTWPILNHPAGKYYSHNRALHLTDVLRASTAAPTYFAPKYLAETHWSGVFADGGVSMHNNPALQLLLVATLQGFPFRWPLRPSLLSLLSVGTGRWETRLAIPPGPSPKFWAKTVPDLLMEDAAALVESILQLLSSSESARTIDREVGDMSMDLLADVNHVCYTRYNPIVDLKAFHEVGEYLESIELDKARDLAAADRVHALLRIGQNYASQVVDERALA